MRIQPAISRSRAQAAFSLLEVMIAIAIFFVAIFAILDLIGQGVRAAHSLSRVEAGPTAGMVAAQQLTMTNKLEEGFDSGDFEEFPDYTWEMEKQLFFTNGLFQVNIFVYHDKVLSSSLSNIIVYMPDSDLGVGSSGNVGSGGLGGQRGSSRR